MNATETENFEHNLRSAAKDLRYPPTPPISAAVIRRLRGRTASRIMIPRWSWVLITALVVLTTLMLVPPARAAIIDFIQIGVVRIFRGPSLPPAPVPTAGIVTPALQGPVTATPAMQLPNATSPSPLGGLAGETTLADAEAHAGFHVLLPTYPPDLGAPDHVYLQDLGGAMLFLVWLEPDGSGHVRMSLQEISPGSWTIGKFGPREIQEATVNGQTAVWAEGPYMLETRNHDYVERRMIAGHVLIWEQDTITYRLETELSLDEAIKIAESLKPPRSSDVPIPADLQHAQILVQQLRGAGITVLSVQHSVAGSLFESANQAAWIETDMGTADAVFFLDPAESEHILVTQLQTQGTGRYSYRIQSTTPALPEARTIDAAIPQYFEVGNGMFIETDSAGLDAVLRRILMEMSTPGN